MTKHKIAGMIDHTLLKATATEAEIEKLCDEARTNHFASVCVNPVHVALAARLLKDTGVRVCTVIGFPLGANTSKVKAFETADAVANGADEVDMVINVGALLAGDIRKVTEDISAVRNAAGGKLTKVIIETCYLSPEQIVEACKAAADAHADFVKTSTGFGTGGAKADDVRLMRSSIPECMSVKASGGIHNYSEAMEMIDAGASRIGASAGIRIVAEADPD